MKRLTLWLCGWFISDHENVADPNVRSRYGLLAGWVSIAINLGLFTIKIILGFLSGSISLIADAFHTMSDAVTSVVVVASFNISRRPPDDMHPYGHGRAEDIGTLILSMLLVLIGIEFFRGSIYRILVPKELNVTYVAVIAVGLTIVVKELLGRFSNIIAELINSDSLRADSWHHRSDAISSIFVVAAMVGGIYGVHWLDGVMGIVVAVIMAAIGVKIFKNAADSLIGARPSKKLLADIYSTAASEEGALDIHDISVHSYGSTKMISLHAQVAQSISPIKAHRIAESIEHKLNSMFKSAHTVVHIDPIDTSREIVRKITREIESFIEAEPETTSFHDVRVNEDGDLKTIEMDLAMKKGTDEAAIDRIRKKLSAKLENMFPDYKASIDIDPDYFYQEPK